MTAKLFVTAGPSHGAEFQLTDRIIFNIGSDRASTVYLEDPKVSPNHCRLYKEDAKFTLFDVSGKGLMVNGKRVVKAVLAENDVISIGDSELRFTTLAAAPAAAGYAPAQAGPPAQGRPEDFRMPLPPDAGEPRGYARVWLQCVEGNDKGKTFDLSEGNVWVIGRGHSADITVMDIKVSRAHCRIDRQGNTFFVNDLNSTNGSYLNGQQIDRQVLHRGDYVKVGYTILAFQYETVEEASGAPAPSRAAPGYPAAPPLPAGAPYGQPAPAYAQPPPGSYPAPDPYPPAPAYAAPAGPAAWQPAPPPMPAPAAYAPQPQVDSMPSAYAQAPSYSPQAPSAPQPWQPAPPPAAQGRRPAPAPEQGRAARPEEGGEDFKVEKLLDYAEESGANIAPPLDHWPGAAPEPAARAQPRSPDRSDDFAGRPQVAAAAAGPGGEAEDDMAFNLDALDAANEEVLRPPAPAAAGEAAYPLPPPMVAPPAAEQRPKIFETADVAVPDLDDDPFAEASPPAAPGPVTAPYAVAAPPPPAGRPPPKKTVVFGSPPFADPGGAAAQGAAFDEVDSLIQGIDLDDDGSGGAAPGAPPLGGYAAGATYGDGDPFAPPYAAPPDQYAPPAPPQGERRQHKTGELPVSGYLLKGGPAPPPVPSERNAPIQCFLCQRPFGPEDLRQGRMRRIKDHYYCLTCCQGF